MQQLLTVSNMSFVFDHLRKTVPFINIDSMEKNLQTMDDMCQELAEIKHRLTEIEWSATSIHDTPAGAEEMPICPACKCSEAHGHAIGCWIDFFKAGGIEV